jgi:hypothetical protein
MNIEKNKHNYNYDNIDNEILPYGWDCVIYIYADKINEKNLQFWSKKKEMDYLRLYCDLHENPGKMVCIYVCKYVYVCLFMYIYIHKCVSVYIFIYINEYLYIYIYIYIYTFSYIEI